MAMAPQRRKRESSSEDGNSSKKQRIKAGVCQFLDIEASESDVGDEDVAVSDIEEYDDFINDEDDGLETRKEDDVESVASHLSRRNSRPEPSESDSYEAGGVDNRMAVVIDRYGERTPDEPEELEYSKSYNDHLSVNEEVDRIAGRLARMPTGEDPALWRVRVRDGTERESFCLLNDRLQARPKLAISVFLPAAGKLWLCVESLRKENVEELCENLSTFPHPLQIILIPIEERTNWLCWKPTKRRIEVGWVRFKRRNKLQELMSVDPLIDPRIMKYADDLAWVPLCSDTPYVDVCVVPRLAVIVGTGKGVNKRPKTKLLPRLLHPMLVGDAEQQMLIDPLLNPDVWWDPKIRYDFEALGQGMHRLIKLQGKKPKAVKNGDVFVPPFAYFQVPVTTLCVETANPKLSKLNVFAEGMAIGLKNFRFNAPHPEFIRWAYDNHIAAPLEIGQAVEVRQKEDTLRGTVVDIAFGEVIVQAGNLQEYAVHPHRVRRVYEVGDQVKVVKGSNVGRQGWVMEVKERQLGVFDRDGKVQIDVQSWQVILYDSFEWGLDRRIQVGDTVDVINPLSEHYQERGLVSSVSEAIVEVKGGDPLSTFYVQPWFLEIHEAHNAEAKSLVGYDRYQELVGTWVWITGSNPNKGIYGRIKESLGNEKLRVEARTGNRLIDIHVDYLMNEEDDYVGRDLQKYHVGRYTTPATKGYRMPNRFRQVPKRASTPGADDPLPIEELTVAELEELGIRTMEQMEEQNTTRTSAVEPLGNVDAAGTVPAVAFQRLANVDNPVSLLNPPPVPKVRTISHEKPVPSEDWLSKNHLADKRIWAHIRNSEPDRFQQGGYERGAYEGERVLIMSCDPQGGILINVRRRLMRIPTKYLVLQRPTGKGQDVVVICGENIGETYYTRKPKEDGTFPLGRRGYKGIPPLCTIEGSSLARCDPK